MWMTWKMAWRNLFRNRRRTLIAGTAIGIGLAALIFTDALMLGLSDYIIRSATASFIGQGQIHEATYRTTRNVESVIKNRKAVLQKLSHDPDVLHYSERVLSPGTVASSADLRPIELVGINPEMEKPVSQIDDAITQGTYLSGTNGQDLVIGARLAELLDVGLGDRVVITVAQAKTGELSQELFRVSGIYRFNVKQMDEGMAFVRINKARTMLGLGQESHEIALVFKNAKMGMKSSPFFSRYSTDGNEAVSWQTLMPQLGMVLKMFDLSMLVVGIILFGVVSLGIINTLFMSIYERMFEFGVLRAVGTRPLQTARLIVFEAGALALVSIVLGLILGFAVTEIVMKTGIDYRGIDMMGVTIRNLVYPRLTIMQFIKYPVWVLVMTMLVGIYPGIYAARLTPARAMRKSL